MTDKESTEHPSVIARYEDAKIEAGAHGFKLCVTRLVQHFLVLTEDGATLRTFSDIAHVEDFLRGVQLEKDRNRKVR